VHTYAVGLDVAGPGLLVALGAGLAGAVVAFFLIVLVEGLILRFMGWGPFGRALLSALLMNVASSLVGLFYAPLLTRINGLIWVLGAFILSVLVEGAVLAVTRKSPFARAAWAAVVTNVVTYIPVALLIVWGAAGLGF
jgi:hypothetical protein